MTEPLAEWLPLLGSVLGALISAAAVLGGVAVGVWMARARERDASHRPGTELSTQPASPNGAPKVSDAFAEELRAERLRLYPRVLQENGKPIEALVAAGVIGREGPKRDQKAIHDALKTVLVQR